MMEIKSCVAVVTGGASGLGEACVCSLTQNGAKVSILDFAEERGQQIASQFGDKVIFCRTDVTDEKSVEEAVNKTMDSFGAIHIAINCAGVGDAQKILGKRVLQYHTGSSDKAKVGDSQKVLGKTELMSLAHFNRVLQINLVGTISVIRLAVEQMVKNSPNEDGERGVIVNTASVAAFDGQVGQAAYSASKAGVVGMTLPIARECAEYGIRVMTIAPGLFDTPMVAAVPENVREALIKMIPFPKRFGRPAEFALLVKHIIENPMLNGEVIRLDGAIRMQPK
jgi:NAD(P)-dependent dehydrogenase (short-subunit alcohol dehydrogenase family)